MAPPLPQQFTSKSSDAARRRLSSISKARPNVPAFSSLTVCSLIFAPFFSKCFLQYHFSLCGPVSRVLSLPTRLALSLPSLYMTRSTTLISAPRSSHTMPLNRTSRLRLSSLRSYLLLESSHPSISANSWVRVLPLAFFARFVSLLDPPSLAYLTSPARFTLRRLQISAPVYGWSSISSPSSLTSNLITPTRPLAPISSTALGPLQPLSPLQALRRRRSTWIIPYSGTLQDYFPLGVFNRSFLFLALSMNKPTRQLAKRSCTMALAITHD